MTKESQSKVLRFIFIVISSILIILISEIFYIKNNRPEYTSYIYLRAAIANINKSKNPFNNLYKSALPFINKNKDKYSNLSQVQFDATTSENYSQEFIINSSEYISSLDPKNTVIYKEDEISVIFYNLALIAYNTNSPDQVPQLLQTAIAVNPQLSHPYVELANYYLKDLDNYEKGFEIVNLCLEFKHPAQHCKDYRESLLTRNKTEEVGFLATEVEKYYKSLRKL